MGFSGRWLPRSAEHEIAPDAVLFLVGLLDTGKLKLLPVEPGAQVASQDRRIITGESVVPLARRAETRQLLFVDQGRHILVDDRPLVHFQMVLDDHGLGRQAYDNDPVMIFAGNGMSVRQWDEANEKKGNP